MVMVMMMVMMSYPWRRRFEPRLGTERKKQTWRGLKTCAEESWSGTIREGGQTTARYYSR